MLETLVIKNRSYRKYAAGETVSEELLVSLIDLARKTASSKNIQPLKYITVNTKEDLDFLFQQLGWAKHLAGWKGPEPNQHPPAYLVMLMDTTLNDAAMIDAGIAAQTILLGATERGLGGCILRTVNRSNLRKYFQIPDNLEIILVIALGKPDQDVRLTEMREDGNYHYYENEQGVHMVPKRGLNEVIYRPQNQKSQSG